MGEKPGVLFLHGVRATHQIWDAQLAAVRAAGYAALAIDLPGHGVHAAPAGTGAGRPLSGIRGRPADESVNIEAGRFTLASAYAEITNALAVLARPTALVGLSLGGYTALAYAAQHPDAPLVGIVAAGCAVEPKGKPVALYRGLAAVSNAGYHQTARTWRRLRHHPEPEPVVPWKLVTDALGELAGHSTLADIREIQLPIWFTNGSHDHLRFQAKHFAALAADGAAVTIPDAGHNVNTDQPDAFSKVLLRALTEFSAR